MFDLKALSADAIPGALRKAERYRLLNEPWQAESIYRDILRTDPQHQAAIVGLILALSDQFGSKLIRGNDEARKCLSRLSAPYDRHYYAGIICERRGAAHLHQDETATALHWLKEALHYYESAEKEAPAENEDAVLRWNACARVIMRVEQSLPRAARHGSQLKGDLPLE